jgi:hypothetical protein
MTEPLWGEAFAYRHALLRDAGYASLARAERARLHVRLARWLEEAAGDRSVEIAEQIAGHYSAALASAPALAQEIDEGLDLESVRRLAAEWYERAGQGSLSLSAHDAARQLLRTSIDMTADDAPLEKARRWERLGDATAFAADMEEGAAAYRTAMELYRTAIERSTVGFDKGSESLNRAADQMARSAEWLARISPEGAASLRAGAEQVRGGSDELQAGKAELIDSLTTARAGLARTAAELAKVMYQQLQFEESGKLAQHVAEELRADADKSSLARLEVAQAVGALGAGGPSQDIETRLERALELSREADDPRVELEALRALTSLRSESDRDDPDAWRQVAEMARRLDDWSTAASASRNAVSWRIDDNASEVFEPLAEIRATALAHGLTEEAGWTDYTEAEAAFVSGDWDRATMVGLRAIDVGEANGYRRMTVRTLHVLIPIASVRGERSVLERAATWYGSFDGEATTVGSPYAMVIRPAQDLELAAAGLLSYRVPQVEPRIASFNHAGGPSWSAALDRVFRAWLEAGELEGAGRALARLSESLEEMGDESSLGLGTHMLMLGRLALAQKQARQASDHALAALDHFRTSSAPWWIAKAIRLIERAGAASGAMLLEVEQIERRLGAREPTR